MALSTFSHEDPLAVQSVHSGQSYQTSLFFLLPVLEGARKVHRIHSVLPADVVRAFDIRAV